MLTYKWILAIKYRMHTLQPTDKKSNNKQGLKEDDGILHRRGNKIDIGGGWKERPGWEWKWEVYQGGKIKCRERR